MSVMRMIKTVEAGGKVTIDNLPMRQGDSVEVTVAALAGTRSEEQRRDARRQFLDAARRNGFTSEGKYPSRDELHERR